MWARASNSPRRIWERELIRSWRKLRRKRSEFRWKMSALKSAIPHCRPPPVRSVQSARRVLLMPSPMLARKLPTNWSKNPANNFMFARRRRKWWFPKISTNFRRELTRNLWKLLRNILQMHLTRIFRKFGWTMRREWSESNALFRRRARAEFWIRKRRIHKWSAARFGESVRLWRKNPRLIRVGEIL